MHLQLFSLLVLLPASASRAKQTQPCNLEATLSKALSLQDMFDKDVGPFQQKYVHLVEDIHSVYGTAKEVHGQIASLCTVWTIAWLVLTVTKCGAVSRKGHTDADR